MKLVKVIAVTVLITRVLEAVPVWGSWWGWGSQKVLSDEESRDLFDSWIFEQRQFSIDRVLANIGGLNENLKGVVAEGAVILSPSKLNPDYFYQWVRDAALTMSTLIQYMDGNTSSVPILQPVVESYIKNAHQIQRVANPSGTFDDLSGLGEPKFMTDNTPFTANWGRPQRDGPGLRVIAILKYLNLFGSSATLDPSWIFNEIVKYDLNYITKYWGADGFDLWEEVYLKHLFTAVTQLKLLQLGIQLCDTYCVDDEDQSFKSELEQLFFALRSFIEIYGFKTSQVPYLIETPALVLKNSRCGLDIATIILSITVHSPLDPNQASLFEVPFDVTDPKVLNTLTLLVQDMKYRYPLNRSPISTSGIGLGRYPEDRYNGNGVSEGNPWFLLTLSLAELLYKLAYHLRFNGVSKETGIAILNMLELPENLELTLVSLIEYLDSFLKVIQAHVDSKGSMSEQFNRYSGYMQGASDLTWSYSSFWNAVRWRLIVTETDDTSN